jgi:uncharacterized protein (DUF849 family)
MLQLCVNGVRTRDDHPAVPVTAAGVAADAVAAAALGVGDLHVHPKDDDGKDTVAGGRVAAFVTAVRQAVPSLPVGVTTGAWIQADPDGLAAAVARWSIQPDHASVNWHEPAAEQVATALLDRKVAVHAGLFTGTDGADRFLASRCAGRVARILVEVVEPDPEAGLRSAERVLARISHYDVPVLLHGQDATCWSTFSRAVQLGLDTRIGLEDTLTLPDGRVAANNTELVRHALSRLAR